MRRLALLLGGLLVGLQLGIVTPGAKASEDAPEPADDDSAVGDDDDSAAGDDDDSAAGDETIDPYMERFEAIDKRLDRLAEEEAAEERREARRRSLPRLKVKLGGRIQADTRFRLQEVGIGGWYDRRTLPVGFSRNENIAKLRLDASITRFRGVLDLDFVLVGLADDPEGLAGLSDRSQIQPYRIEAHSAYIHARDLIVRGLDLRVGQQLVQWGVGDQFNPTNLLNADDMEDPLLFGEQQGNLMVRIDYTVKDVWTFSGVAVPIFRPALLPASGELALAAVDRLPFLDEELRWRIHSESQFSVEALGYPTIVSSVRTELPKTNLKNVQFALRAAGIVAKQDIALSFYRGFHDFPVAYQNINTLDEGAAACINDPEPPEVRQGEPDEDEECIEGLITTETVLSYPRVHVIGLNVAGEIPVVGIGYRLEVGVFFPQERRIAIYNPAIPPFVEAGEYDYDADGEPGGGDGALIVSRRVFAKWSLGLDYSIGSHLMFNVQWVHGMTDEFGSGDFLRPADGWTVRQGSASGLSPAEAEATGGASLFQCAVEGEGRQCAREILRPRLADYLVFGVDFNFARNAALIRVFTLWDLSGYYEQYWDMESAQRVNEFHHPFSPGGFSAVIYPEFRYNFGHGFELNVGAVFQLGRDYTKFGDPAAGGHQLFLRGRYSF